MTERQAWLKVARMLRREDEIYVCFAIDGLECEEDSRRETAMFDRMKRQASRWAHRLRKVPFDPNGCIEAYDPDTVPSTVAMRGRIAFCKEMAAKAAARATARATLLRGAR
jgi:hypothetical protein